MSSNHILVQLVGLGPSYSVLVKRLELRRGFKAIQTFSLTTSAAGHQKSQMDFALSRFCLAEFSGAGSLFRLLLVGRAEDTLSLKSSTFSTKGMASLHKMLGLVNPSATIKLLTIMRHASKNGKCKWNIGMLRKTVNVNEILDVLCGVLALATV